MVGLTGVAPARISPPASETGVSAVPPQRGLVGALGLEPRVSSSRRKRVGRYATHRKLPKLMETAITLIRPPLRKGWRGAGGSNSYLLVGSQARTPVRQARSNLAEGRGHDPQTVGPNGLANRRRRPPA